MLELSFLYTYPCIFPYKLKKEIVEYNNVGFPANPQ